MNLQNAWTDTICESLHNEPDRWCVGEDSVRRDDDLELWTGELPVFSLKLTAPEVVYFSLKNKVRLHQALSRAKLAHAPAIL